MKWGAIDDGLLDIVQIFDIILVAHLATVATVNTHAFWNIHTTTKK